MKFSGVVDRNIPIRRANGIAAWIDIIVDIDTFHRTAKM
jgi:hypothetical protein